LTKNRTRQLGQYACGLRPGSPKIHRVQMHSG